MSWAWWVINILFSIFFFSFRYIIREKIQLVLHFSRILHTIFYYFIILIKLIYILNIKNNYINNPKNIYKL